MSFYRERFGHREGEFPVCRGRRRAARLALPFFPELTEGPRSTQVRRGALARASLRRAVTAPSA